ncbi:MAG TPA: DnaJ domain-containing protein [Nitrosopumilaceae archaeon]|nr:DnaJ domain-containing protein [Nitrosopumilaceae archaeon]
MKKLLFFFPFVLQFFTTPVFSQESEAVRKTNELIVSNQDLIIIFSSFITAVIAIFLYLARNQILRRKLSYDIGDFESKKNRDYEKYHSDWTSDEFVGKKAHNNDNDEYRKAIKNSNFPNFYKILEIENDATQEEIKNQFRRLVKEWHPDKNPDPDTKEKMAEINKAYEVLSDIERRKNYDKYFDIS